MRIRESVRVEFNEEVFGAEGSKVWCDLEGRSLDDEIDGSRDILRRTLHERRKTFDDLSLGHGGDDGNQKRCVFGATLLKDGAHGVEVKVDHREEAGRSRERIEGVKDDLGERVTCGGDRLDNLKELLGLATDRLDGRSKVIKTEQGLSCFLSQILKQLYKTVFKFVSWSVIKTTKEEKKEGKERKRTWKRGEGDGAKG